MPQERSLQPQLHFNMQYINTSTKEYPVLLGQIQTQFPNTTWVSPESVPAPYRPVEYTPQPAYNVVTQVVKEIEPLLVAGVWMQQWVVEKRYANQADEDAAVAADQVAKNQALQNSIVDATQLRLDTFAQTRNYSSILSASTYATSNVARFQAEGEYCVNQRDATWAKLYQILAEVQAGTRPMPTGYADIEAELPVLVWP